LSWAVDELTGARVVVLANTLWNMVRAASQLIASGAWSPPV
jgi:hypothetical protein